MLEVEPATRARRRWALRHERRRLTPSERLRIAEEYLAGADLDLMIERWQLGGRPALMNVVSRVLGETARMCRKLAIAKGGP